MRSPSVSIFRPAKQTMALSLPGLRGLRYPECEIIDEESGWFCHRVAPGFPCAADGTGPMSQGIQQHEQLWIFVLISVRTTEFSGADSVGKAFESVMFGRTNAFTLSDEEGRVRIETAELRQNGPKVCRVKSTGHFVDLEEETATTILFPVAGQLRVRVAAADFRITPSSICVFGPNARRTRTEAPRSAELFHANALLIPHKALSGLLQADDAGARWAGLPDGLPISAKSTEVRRLSDLLGYVAGHFDQYLPQLSDKAGAAMATLIEELLTEVILRSTPAIAESDRIPASLPRVLMAEEIMRARSGEAFSMASLAGEVGVGLRSLQLAFISARAMRPRDVLLRMRLERSRERLLTAKLGETVTSIALDCGFAHLGRFPAAYRMAFGELPAETLAQSRRRLA